MTPDNPRLIANWQPTSVSELIDIKPIDAPLRNMAPLAVRVPRLPVRRPTSCREFEPGSEACLDARCRAGIHVP